MTAEQKNGL